MAHSKLLRFAHRFAGNAACLGPFNFGLALGWSSAVEPQLTAGEVAAAAADADRLTLNADDWSWVASLVTLGSLAGALLGGPVADWLGRKNGLLLTTAPSIVGWLLIIAAQNSGQTSAVRRRGVFVFPLTTMCSLLTCDIHSCTDGPRDSQMPLKGSGLPCGLGWVGLRCNDGVMMIGLQGCCTRAAC